MADTSNNTQVNVDIGASNSYKSIISSAIKDFSNFWKSASGGSDAQGAASTFESLASKLGISSKAMLVGTVGVGLLAAGLVAGGVAAVKMASNFQQSTSTLVTTAGVSQKNYSAMQQGILGVSAATGTAANSVSQAMYVIASHTFNATSGASNGLLVLKASAEAAKTENADLGTVALAVSSAMVDYHQSASQAADTASKLTAAVGAGGATFQEFSGALHSVLPIASAAHVKLNDILGDVASMTQHGMSADQATQNLAETIRTLQSPSAAASQYLASLGIQSQNLSGDLGTKGVSGTLEMVSNAIMQHMGPSGKVLISAFNQSKSAATDLNSMISNMPGPVQALAKQFESGAINMSTFRKEIPTNDQGMLSQFESLYGQVNGFNSLLKSGSPAALSYSQALQKATGNATTMNTALMLTGGNYKNTTKAIEAVTKATADSKGNVQGWSVVQGNLNQVLSQWKATLAAAFIEVGLKLLPAVTTVTRFLLDVMMGAIQGIGHAFSSFGASAGGVGAILGKVIAFLAPSFSALGNTIKTQLLPALDMIFQSVGRLSASMQPELLDILKVVGIVIGATLVAAIYLVVNALRIFVDAFSLLYHAEADVVDWISDIVHLFMNLQGDMFSIGGKIIEGLISGLIPGGPQIVKTINSIGGSMVNALKGMLGIHSPSTVFAEIGQNMGKGLIQGLQGIQAQANVAATALVTGSGLVNSNGTAMTTNTSSVSTSSSVDQSSNGNISIGQLVIQAPNGATMATIMASINQDALNVSRGGAPTQGAAA